MSSLLDSIKRKTVWTAWLLAVAGTSGCAELIIADAMVGAAIAVAESANEPKKAQNLDTTCVLPNGKVRAMSSKDCNTYGFRLDNFTNRTVACEFNGGQIKTMNYRDCSRSNGTVSLNSSIRCDVPANSIKTVYQCIKDGGSVLGATATATATQSSSDQTSSGKCYISSSEYIEVTNDICVEMNGSWSY